VTKVELAGEVAKIVGDLTKAKAAEIIDAFFNAISSGLAMGEMIQVVGFGAFEVQQRAARKGRNPQKPTEVIDIPAKTVPVFRAGKALKDAVDTSAGKKKKK
jgi:DNA-binding protein HU-beta